MILSLHLGGHQTEHIEAEHELGLKQQQYFLFVDGDEVAGRLGTERRRVALVDAEDAFGLDDVRGADGLADATGVVVAERINAQGAAGEEDEVGAGVALANQPLAGDQFGETELGVSCHLHQVGKTHALEERKLQ